MLTRDLDSEVLCSSLHCALWLMLACSLGDCSTLFACFAVWYVLDHRQGRFAFTSDVGGEHVICFSTNSTRWFGMPRKFVRFSMRRGPSSC